LGPDRESRRVSAHELHCISLAWAQAVRNDSTGAEPDAAIPSAPEVTRVAGECLLDSGRTEVSLEGVAKLASERETRSYPTTPRALVSFYLTV